MSSFLAGIYCRVSTDEQARDGFSIAAQRDRLLAFCRSQGWDVAGIYADEDHSGATLDRPQLTRLREDVRAGRVNVVLVWKSDPEAKPRRTSSPAWSTAARAARRCGASARAPILGAESGLSPRLGLGTSDTPITCASKVASTKAG